MLWVKKNYTLCCLELCEIKKNYFLFDKTKIQTNKRNEIFHMQNSGFLGSRFTDYMRSLNAVNKYINEFIQSHSMCTFWALKSSLNTRI